MTTIVSPTTKPAKPKNEQAASAATNDTPITEEELKKKETPITISDVLRLKKATNGKNNSIKNSTILR
ncbi:unnamed protein product [Adineta steineri]|uniref:Uncharacterized protein n=1 Tax=Adineta steineri TaxID=433720 RepID=A0A820SIC1_9BILA|nr:unnamed protein product [Adineta steineri]